MQKTCTRCSLTYDHTREFFFVRYHHGDQAHLSGSCKKCDFIQMKIWRAKNQEHLVKYKRIQMARKRLEKPLEVKYAKHQEYLKHKEAYCRRARAYRHAHPELDRAKGIKRRDAEGTWDANTIRRLWWFQNGKCHYCTKSLDAYHVDHRIPVTRGGNNWPHNICLACPECNMRKHTKTENEFFEILEVA